MQESKVELGYTFKDPQLLKRAFTQSSYSAENYERLEFLGDSILDFLVGEYFYKHCDESEGKLTVLRSHFVSENYLAKLFDKLNLKGSVILGKSYQGEVSKAIKGDIIEAILAGIYLDGGLEEAKKFIERHFELDSYQSIIDDNYKSRLQELVQSHFKCKIGYDTVACEDGFEATFFMDEDKIAHAKGKSKQEAEQNCAKIAISKLFLIN